MKKRATRKRKNMSEVKVEETNVPPVPEIEKLDIKNDVYLNIEPEGEDIIITLRAPKVAEIIQKMTAGNYQRSEMDKSLAPCMMDPVIPDNISKEKGAELVKTHFVTRPAISRITKNFAGATSIDFASTPPAALLYNWRALQSTPGLVIRLKMEKPPAPELLRKWGKQVIDGIADIVSNARPFRMTWTMTETPPVNR